MVLRVSLMVTVAVVAAAAGVVGGVAEAAAVGGGGTPLAHIAGAARKIRMYIKNSFLQLTPDGRVSGVLDPSSHHTLLQRSSVDRGKVKIQGVTTCLYLCMDTCGLPYAAKEFTDECIFNETIEQHNYNTYSSVKYSNGRRTLYLALNKKGLPRRVQIRAGTLLGKLSTYTRVLPQPVSPAEAEAVKGARCPALGAGSGGGASEAARCRRPRRRRRKRKRCKEDDEECLRRRGKTPATPRLRHRKHRTLPEPDPLDTDDYDEPSLDYSEFPL